jgi:PAS domain-containing protein
LERWNLKRDPKKAEELRELMERKRSLLEAMRIAFLHRAPLNGKIPDDEAVRHAARDFIDANYALQRTLFGRVRVKLSVPRLLR